ncbi:chromatin assembly factor 1 subunit FAS2-like [Carya illinoinensis]|uniref:chromatin assembly factor 1 subunit FAS2-like n=1 Tax=Carya illinoinensis TaxID=32201 RepID=UPI001C71A8C6|nr:chromatin assembly factor 1 subunit FAS2-like [Carya illinoinensis]
MLMRPLFLSGSCKISTSSETVNKAYIFSRNYLSRPALQLPGASKPVVAVRFCPVVFSLRGSTPAALFKLPYRLIFAVATLNSLYLYDTESIPPIAILAGLHYAAITDITWSPDGRYLALSSQDGYCTILEFEHDERGSPISLSEGKKVMVDENQGPVQKPEDMVIDATRKDFIIAADSTKSEAGENERKLASPSSKTTPISNKQAKRRITPLAIDP